MRFAGLKYTNIYLSVFRGNWLIILLWLSTQVHGHDKFDISIPAERQTDRQTTFLKLLLCALVAYKYLYALAKT